jgi:chemotaxis protein CheX
MSELGTFLGMAFKETLSMFGFNVEHNSTVHSETLSSSSDMNVVLGFTGDARGSIVIALPKKTASVVSSIMIGTDEITAMTKSALAELSNMIAGSAISKSSKFMNLTPPSVVAGDNIYLMISRVRSTNMDFHLNGSPITVSFAVE